MGRDRTKNTKSIIMAIIVLASLIMVHVVLNNVITGYTSVPAIGQLSSEYLSLVESSEYYQPCDSRFLFSNGIDHHSKALEGMMQALHDAGECQRGTVIFDGGANEGQTLSHWLKFCSGATYHAVEMQPAVYKKTMEMFKHNPSVFLYNLGWSSKPGTVHFKGGGQTARIVRESVLVDEGAGISTITMVQFHEQAKADIVTYTVIDTEGHEPLVIESMHLELEENRRRFPAIQYETGEGWRWEDGSWDFEQTATHLEQAGYHLYLMGGSHFWRVAAKSFEYGKGVTINVKGHCNTNMSTTKPMFAWTNVVALHSEYANRAIYNFVDHSAKEHAKKVRRDLEKPK